MFFKTVNQSEVETEEETSTNEIGTLEHLEEMHEQIIQVTTWMIRGREKAKHRLLTLRRRWPHYFQSIKLYNRIIGELEIQENSYADNTFRFI